MLTPILLSALLLFPDPIDLGDHGLTSALGRSSASLTHDGEIVIKGKEQQDRFLVFRSDMDAPLQGTIADIPVEKLPVKGKMLRIIQNIVKIEELYLVYALIVDEHSRLNREVLTFDQDPEDGQRLRFVGFARSYNHKKSPFLRNLVAGPNGRYFGLEVERDKPDEVVFRWSEFLIKIDDNNLPVFRKIRSSFFVNTESLAGIAGAYNRSWIAATPDGGKLLAISEVGDFARLFTRSKGYQYDGTLPLSLDGFVSYKMAFSSKAQEDISGIALNRLQNEISKNTGLYSLEGMGDLFVLGYEVPANHPSEKMALVLQVIDSQGTTLLTGEPIPGGLFVGLLENQAVVLVPELTTKSPTDYRVEMIRFE